MATKPKSAADPPSACAACRADMEHLLAQRSLLIRYRPVSHLSSSSIWGHIAIAQGPPNTLFYSPQTLSASAHVLGLAAPLARLYFQSALAGYQSVEKDRVLILSLVGWNLLTEAGALPEILRDELERLGPPKHGLVLIHPGRRNLMDDKAESQIKALRALARMNVIIASNNPTCDRDEADFWSRIPVTMTVTDADFLAGVDRNTLMESRFPAMISRQLDKGRAVLVDGITSISELRTVGQLGASHGAGDFIGRPNRRPSLVMSAAASKVLLENADHGADGAAQPQHLLERLYAPTPPVSPVTTAERVFELFEKSPDLRAVAVAESDRPLGVISRYTMVENLARPYRHELYGRKSCTRFMDPDAVMVDVRLTLPEISQVIIEAPPHHLISGFIVTDNGRYLGIGYVQDLMREITQMQLDAARYANPLTELPGNVPTNLRINELLELGEAFVIGYCDLDNFKPFNDVYGYAKGDEVIRLTARVLEDVCDPDMDFLGHIGGDDFILVLRSKNWLDRCQQALDIFTEQIRNFFSQDDLERGGYVTENRKGLPEFHSITALSIGIVEAVPGAFQNHLSIARIAAEVKKQAKAIVGNSLFINQRTYQEAADSREPPRDPAAEED